MRDISVSESEDLPKILAPLIEDGPQAVLGKPTQQTSAGNSEAQRKQMLQIVKLTAPSIKKLQVCACHHLICKRPGLVLKAWTGKRC